MRCALALLTIPVLALFGCDKGQPTVKTPTLPPATELVKKDLKVGTGEVVAKADTVTVRYRGWLDNGFVFDENPAPKAPYTFAVGAGTVIPGWDEGVPGMRVGGKRNLRIPSKLGYGKEGNPPKIPPNVDLNFDIEVLDVVKGLDANSIKVEVLQEGKGSRELKIGDTVTIRYEIKLQTGKVIDSSEERGGDVTLDFGENVMASPGVQAGIAGMKVGEIRKITVPGALSMPSMDAPGRSMIQIATVEIIKIK